MITLAQEAARRAGDCLIGYFGRGSLKVDTKSRADFVSDADRAAEDVIRAFLSEELPDHALLMEESGASGESDWQWVVDPLDGTTNFIHRYPFFGVSLALRHRGKTVLGVVYDPIRVEMFTAEDGEPARLNGVPISLAPAAAAEDALVATGFPFRRHHQLDAYLQLFSRVLRQVADLRRSGSAALDLAYVAAGRYDAFFEFGLKPWDTAAGALLVACAGGTVTDFHGGDKFDQDGDIIAGAKSIHPLLLDATRAVFSERPG